MVREQALGELESKAGCGVGGTWMPLEMVPNIFSAISSLVDRQFYASCSLIMLSPRTR